MCIAKLYHTRGIFMGLFNLFKKKKTVDQYSKQSTSNAVKSIKQSSKSNYSPSDINPILKKKFNNDLLPGEIILINWLDNRVEPLNFPKYFTSQYGVNPNSGLKQLLKDSYIQQGGYTHSLKGYKVAELKEKLAVKGLATTGKKLDLAERLSEHLTDAEKTSLPFSYEATALGGEMLKEYNYIIMSHSDKHFPTVDAILFKAQQPSLGSYNDLKWSYLNQELNKHFINFNRGPLRNTFLAMGEQLYYEYKPLDALTFYICVQIIDCSGISSSDIYYYENILFAPGIIEMIKKCNHLAIVSDYTICFDRAVDTLRGLRSKGFVTSKDLKFLKQELRYPRITVLKEYFSKYKKYTIKYHLGI